MHPDAALRAAIAAAPDAALPRLVYADFLDDHGQPDHAAALRLDVALAAERPWADRYWQLKVEPPADFPAALGRLADRQPLLVGVPDDWKSRWRAVRAFVSRWWDAPLGDVGRWGAAVEEAERAAGRELPPSVKEWAAFAAEFPSGPQSRYGGIRDIVRFDRLDDGLSFLTLDEGNVRWWVQFDRLAINDPPVEVTYGQPGEESLTTEWEAGSMSEFVLSYLAGYRRGQDEASHTTNYPTAAAARLDPLFPHTGLFGRHRAFESAAAAALLFSPMMWNHAVSQVWALSRQPVVLDRIAVCLAGTH